MPKPRKPKRIEINTEEKRYIGGQVRAFSGNRMMEVVANSGQVDRYNERIPASSLNLKNYKKNPVIMWAHDYSQPPIGKAVALRNEDDALIAEIQFAETEQAEDIYQLYKGGFLNAVSIGFQGKEFSVDKATDELTWTSGELLEISAVPIPADPQAVARRVKMLAIEDEEADGESDGMETTETLIATVGSDILDELIHIRASLSAEIEHLRRDIEALVTPKAVATITDTHGHSEADDILAALKAAGDAIKAKSTGG